VEARRLLGLSIAKVRVGIKGGSFDESSVESKSPGNKKRIMSEKKSDKKGGGGGGVGGGGGGSVLVKNFARIQVLFNQNVNPSGEQTSLRQAQVRQDPQI